MMLSALRSLFSASSLRKEAGLVYSQLMAQARNPYFYQHCGVPDSLDGRFEMLVLQVFLYQQKGEIAPQLMQALLELLIDDMDRTLREMGVGDMGVSRRIRQMGDALNGRLLTYKQAMSEGKDAMHAALLRNVFGTVAPETITPEQLECLWQATQDAP
jgi:cytochrome b pre-mRNA-processing protein 3